MVKSKRKGPGNGSVGTRKKKKSILKVPLPEEDVLGLDSDASDVGEDELAEEDLELLEASAGQLEFLSRLPRKEIDKSVSETRKKQPLPRHSLEQGDPREQASPTSSKESSDEEEEEEEDIEDDGEAWERGPRKVEPSKKEKKVKGKSLPIKSLDGKMVQHPDGISGQDFELDGMMFEGVTVLDDGTSSKKEEERMAGEAKRQKERELQRIEKEKEKASAILRKQQEAQQALLDEKNKDKRFKDQALESLIGCTSKSERREKAKFVIAKASQSLLAAPETQLKKQIPILLELIGDYDSYVSKLSILSMLAIMRDLIPAYRIRPIHEREKEDIIQSKEVKELWDYENILLKSYQSYLKVLLKAFKNQKNGTKSALMLSKVAAKCLSALVVSAPHFNFSGDILQVIIPGIANKEADIREMCSNAITTLVKSALHSADSGQCAVEATQLLADFVKRRKCTGLPPHVVACLLDFEFPDITSADDLEKASKSRKAKKKKKKKTNDDVSKAFKEAQAVIDKDTRLHQQSAVLEAMFEIYFRVLKTAEGSLRGIQASHGNSVPPASWSSNKFAKRFPLMTPTLHGLAKFSHLISVDYFNDLIVTLENIVEQPTVPHDIRCRCLLTASQISKGQGESLNIDRAALYTALYKAMYSTTTIPMEEEDPKLPGVLTAERVHQCLPPSIFNQPKQSIEDSSQYLVSKILEDMLLDSQKALDIHRQAAFTKRTATIALHTTDSGLALAMLYVIYRMMKRYPKLRIMLEDDEGSGPSSTYYGSIVSKKNSSKTSVEYANEDPSLHTGALYTPLWELAILADHHANPGVRRAAEFVSAMNVSAAQAAASGTTGEGGVASLPSIFQTPGTMLSPSAVALSNSTQLGSFHPPVQGRGTLKRSKTTTMRERSPNRWVGFLDVNAPGL